MSWAQLGLAEEAATNVLTLIEGIEAEELWRSRLTRQEVKRQLLDLANSLGPLQSTLHGLLPELDWNAWATTVRQLQNSSTENEALWFAASALTPATLMWLRFYREREPQLFAFKL
jgi:hypothetical protein